METNSRFQAQLVSTPDGGSNAPAGGSPGQGSKARGFMPSGRASREFHAWAGGSRPGWGMDGRGGGLKNVKNLTPIMDSFVGPYPTLPAPYKSQGVKEDKN